MRPISTGKGFTLFIGRHRANFRRRGLTKARYALAVMTAWGSKHGLRETGAFMGNGGLVAREEGLALGKS